MLSKTLILALLMWAAFLSDPAIAKIYKYKDEHGKTHFTDDASKIPLRYRNKDTVKKFKGVSEPAGSSSTSNELLGQKKAEKDDDKDGEDVGLSSKDEALVKKSIQVFKSGVERGNQYKDSFPNFAVGQGAVNAIQSALPAKEELAKELEGTKEPVLQEALGFLRKSIAVDKQTTSIGAGLQVRIKIILDRLGDEGKQQAVLIQKLEKSLKDSEKKKADAAKKKEEEAEKEKKK